MLCQVAADFLDPGDQSGRRVAAAEVLLHGRRDRIPNCLTYAFVRTAVSDDGKLASRGDDQEVDGVPRRQLREAVPPQRVMSRPTHVPPDIWCDRHGDRRVGRPLGAKDRFSHAFLVDELMEARIHHEPDAPPPPEKPPPPENPPPLKPESPPPLKPKNPPRLEWPRPDPIKTWP
jgi:hypothetical protein